MERYDDVLINKVDRLQEKIKSQAALIKSLVEALRKAETYLVERGIEVRGTVGRTIVLPTIRKAIKSASDEVGE